MKRITLLILSIVCLASTQTRLFASAQLPVTVATYTDGTATLTDTASVDGDDQTIWNSPDDIAHAWIQYDLGTVKSVGRLVLTLPSGRSFPIKVEVGAPGSWTTAFQGIAQNATVSWDTTFAAVDGRYVKLSLTAAGSDGTHVLSITETEMWSDRVNHLTDSGPAWINADSVTPGFDLDVHGEIRASAVRIVTTGADYVFEDGYSLLSLADLAEFIAKHRHLPGIDPADTMQTDGMALGKQAVKHLEKIEELTLHAIAADKAIKHENQRLEEQIVKLRILTNRKDESK